MFDSFCYVFRVACGIVARSAGLFENAKRLCECDGITIWDERDVPMAGEGRNRKMDIKETMHVSQLWNIKNWLSEKTMWITKKKKSLLICDLQSKDGINTYYMLKGFLKACMPPKVSNEMECTNEKTTWNTQDTNQSWYVP